jgi:hypothetical protein
MQTQREKEAAEREARRKEAEAKAIAEAKEKLVCVTDAHYPITSPHPLTQEQQERVKTDKELQEEADKAKRKAVCSVCCVRHPLNLYSRRLLFC